MFSFFSGDDELDALIADSAAGGGGGHDSLLGDLRISDFMDGEGVGGARFLRYSFPPFFGQNPRINVE